jgi:hypothetical protein
VPTFSSSPSEKSGFHDNLIVGPVLHHNPASTQIDQAVVGIWTANLLDSVVTGSIWDGEAPPYTPFPYCVFYPISTVPRRWASGSYKGFFSEYQDVLFQLSVYLKEDGLNDPKMQVGRIIDQLKGVYDNAQLQFDINTGYSLMCRRTNEHICRAPGYAGDGIYQGDLTYKVVRHNDVAKQGGN